MQLDDLGGLWRRSLLVRADGRRDTTASVQWLQGPTLYADLRQPSTLRASSGYARSITSRRRRSSMPDPWNGRPKLWWSAAAMPTISNTGIVMREAAWPRPGLQSCSIETPPLPPSWCAASDVETARALIDCEISIGLVNDRDWRITASTLPTRVGRALAERHRSRWDIVEFEGNISDFPT